MEMRLDGPQMAVFMDFENVATSAEANLGDFDVNTVMDLLRSRGRLLIKRAYGDWGRFHRYRRPMLENGIDLFQLYSVGVQHKNRADVRLAIDAMETVFTRPQIDVFAIVSGDSDFTELIHKLRDYGKYTIGIGLHAATSDLLRRACDEFIFYETLVAEEISNIADELQLPDPRDLLHRALLAAEQKGETPVFAGRLKQIMLGLDSSFNETNYGYQQFRAFLEAHQDMVAIQDQGMQLYISLRREPRVPPTPGDVGTSILSADGAPAAPAADTLPPPPVTKPVADMGQRYRSFLREAGMRMVEPSARRQVLADFLTTLHDEPEAISLNAAADSLKDRYDGENALTQKIAVADIMRLLIMSGALTFAGHHAAGDAPLRHADALALDQLAQDCDAAYVWRLVEGGLPVYPDQLAPVLYGYDAGSAAAELLCDRLVEREMIARCGDTYCVAPCQITRLMQQEELLLATANVTRTPLPVGEPLTVMTAEDLFKQASDLRQKDFAGSAQRYLQAARVQLELLRTGQPRAGFDDLKWYLTSYCSVKAGHAFVTGNYSEAIPYYLAFFGLAQEADSVWPRIQRLVNPMASYFFAIAGKQVNEVVPPNLGRSPAAQVALRIHNHANPDVCLAWEDLMTRLACVNLGMIRQTYREVNALMAPMGSLGQMNGMAGNPPASDNTARIEHTRAFLADLIAQREGEGESAEQLIPLPYAG
jgi:uncharacterized protein (TIGR00288 family)